MVAQATRQPPATCASRKNAAKKAAISTIARPAGNCSSHRRFCVNYPNYLRLQKFLNPLIECVTRATMMGQIELFQWRYARPLIGQITGDTALERRMNKMLARIVSLRGGRFACGFFRLCWDGTWFSVGGDGDGRAKTYKVSLLLFYAGLVSID